MHKKDLACALGFVAAMGVISAALIIALEPSADKPEDTAFAQSPNDRPVLETVDQVWQARATDVSTFWFDGIHYTVTGLPEEYVDYSAWRCRLE